MWSKHWFDLIEMLDIFQHLFSFIISTFVTAACSKVALFIQQQTVIKTFYFIFMGRYCLIHLQTKASCKINLLPDYRFCATEKRKETKWGLARRAQYKENDNFLHASWRAEGSKCVVVNVAWWSSQWGRGGQSKTAYHSLPTLKGGKSVDSNFTAG